MSEGKRIRVSGIVVREHLVASIVVWLKLAMRVGYYPEDVINEAMERIRGEKLPTDG